MTLGMKLPLIVSGTDPVYQQLRQQQGNQGLGSLIHEYPFVYTMMSFLYNMTAMLDQLLQACRDIGANVTMLQAAHIRLEKFLQLSANRLSIIHMVLEHSSTHATQL